MHLVAKQVKGHEYFYLVEKQRRGHRVVTARTVYIGDRQKLADLAQVMLAALGLENHAELGTTLKTAKTQAGRAKREKNSA